jgi:hypothetical protein
MTAEPVSSEAPEAPPAESVRPTAATTAAAAPTPPAIEPVPPLVDESGQPLPQTEERPSVDSPSFHRRLELLVQAIADDDPALALPAFFPVVAYQQVKAIAKPEDDWQRRLVAAFDRSIHEYHKKLGPNASSAGLAGLDLDEARVKFMKPHSEGNNLGYYRVTHSTLRLRTEGGEQRFEITSLISWRGEWYVVHLHGFE